MNKERIFCLGRPIVDIFAEVKESHLESLGLGRRQKDKISEEEIGMIIQPLSRKADYFFISTGGIEINLAINMSFLGIDVDFSGTVGDDCFSWLFTNDLEREKAQNLNLFLKSKEGKTASILFVKAVNSNGGRKDIKMVNYGASEYLPWDGSTKNILSRATVFFSSLFSANTFETEPVWEEAISFAKKLDKKIIIDLGGIDTVPKGILRKVVNIVRENADIISTNVKECEFVQNYDKKEISSVFSKTGLIFITRRKKECLIFNNGKEVCIPFPTEKIPSESERIFETGSTDAFFAGFISAFLRGANLKQAGRFAADVSLIKIRYPESHLTKNSLKGIIGGEYAFNV